MHARNLPGVNYYCPIGVVSSPGTAARGYLSAMRAASIPVSVVPTHELFTHIAGIDNIEPRQRPRHKISIVHANADAVHRFLHYHARSFARATYRIGLWVWELPAFRDEFWSEFRHFDEIWVASRFCQRAIQALTAKPVTVVPHVIIPADTAPQPGYRETLNIAADEFVFMYMFDATSMVERKNPHCLLDAFDAAFSDKDRVRLVLKVTYAEADPEFSSYLDAAARRNKRLTVIRRLMKEDELASLVSACDCYVSPHRTEGFGLTVAEAMVFGLPVIATDYSGTADFVTEDVAYPLRYQLVEVDRDYGPYGKGAIWSEPSREHLQELMRSIVADPPAAAEKGRRARSRMLAEYSAAAVGRRIGERLAAIALD